MDDAAYEAQKNRVTDLIDRWVKTIGLGWWRITYRYRREFAESESASNYETKMQCEAQWKYSQACITVYVPAIAECSDDALEWLFLHECMHIFLAEMRVETSEQAVHQQEHEERVASSLASAFLWLRDSLAPEEEAV